MIHRELLLMAVKGTGCRGVVIAVAQVLVQYDEADLDQLPTQREIAASADTTERSVRRALVQLTKLGLVTSEVKAHNRRRLHLNREGLEIVAASGFAPHA
jgi:DNA-binding FadR family transcriptional regulator